MSKKIRYSVIVVVIAALLLLVGCDSGKVNTSLELDESFSGQRVMSFDIYTADLPVVSLVRVSDIVDLLDENCPEQLVMATEEGKTGTKCIFTLPFANQNEYETKLTALLGRKPNISYAGPSDDVFVSGITLSEDFTSADLFTWAQEALMEKYSKFADKITDNIGKGETSVVFEGAEIKTSAAVNVTPVHTSLFSLAVMTTRFGEDDYTRDICILVDPEDLELMGRERFISTFCEPIAARVGALGEGGWSDEHGCYVLHMNKGSLEDLTAFTAAVFPGSSAEQADIDDGAFTESSAVFERFSLAGYPCNDDGTTNLVLEYTAGDDTTFSGDSVSAANGGKLSDDKKTINYSFANVSQCDVTVVSETRYSVDNIEIDSELSMTGRLTQSVTLTFPEECSRSAAQRAQRFLADQYAASGLTVSVEKIDGAAAVVSGSSIGAEDVYALTLTASGTPEEVSAAFTAAFGEGNSYSSSAGSILSLKRLYNVSNKIDITQLAQSAAYDGEYVYSLNVPMSTFTIAKWNDYAGQGSDMIFQNIKREKVDASRIGSSAFEVTAQYRQLNLPFIIGAAIALILGCCILVMISNILSSGLNHRRESKKIDAKAEAVKCVALALVPDDKKGEISELPPELIRRPTAVISPRNDEGLDEPEDEPEGLMLFVSTLRILLVALIVLFFFPFCFVSSTLKTVKLSGFDLFMGKEIFGTVYPADRITAILVVIPLIMLICLYARSILPRILTPLFVTGASLWQIFYLYKLPETLDQNMEIVRQTVTGYITAPSRQMQMAHTYSIVIYVLIAIAGIMLLFSDLGLIITRDRRAEECA